MFHLPGLKYLCGYEPPLWLVKQNLLMVAVTFSVAGAATAVASKGYGLLAFMVLFVICHTMWGAYLMLVVDPPSDRRKGS